MKDIWKSISTTEKMRILVEFNFIDDYRTLFDSTDGGFYVYNN